MNADGATSAASRTSPAASTTPRSRPTAWSLLADGAGTGLYSVRVADGRVKRLTDGQDFSPTTRPMGGGSSSAATATRSCTRELSDAR